MSVQQYRKKPVVVEAVQLRWDTWNEMCDFAPVGEDGCRGVWVDPETGGWCDDPPLSGDVPSAFTEHTIGLIIPTLEGTMLAVENDWIVRGTRGEYYPCKPGPFEDTFELVPS